MADVFRHDPKRGLVSWFDRRPARSNQYCLYCSAFVGDGAELPSGKEHLVGRNMVPPNAFADPSAFNFHFRACNACNSEKSRLEDHVAAVTLLSSPGRGERQDVDDTARRKAKGSFDPKLRQPLADVRHNHEVKLGGIFTFGLISGPQLDLKMATLLAFRHIQGLFSLVTSENPLVGETTNLLPGESFHLFGLYPFRDFGNPQLVEIGKRARSLTSTAEVATADGYFQAALRHEVESWWFWALEWNKSYRLVGWIGKEKPPPLFQNLPELKWNYFGDPSSHHGRMRTEVPLDPDIDTLFGHDAKWPTED